ncbi:MAG: sigma-70 family RNA polymerase sigma factor [Nannocystaceae bacterium]|nr:sigma-70 family RNA polymerase sigma factor [Nannocystaceae bacterium]
MSEAIAAAYRTHGPSVLRRARRILANDADAREVVQDVFLSLVDRPEQFSGRSSLMTFLYRATTNRCLNHIRNAKTRLRLLEQRGAVDVEEGPGAEQQAIVRDLLRQLPEEQAQALVYYYVDEMSQAEISDVLGCSRRHVGNLLERVRAAAEQPEARA